MLSLCGEIPRDFRTYQGYTLNCSLCMEAHNMTKVRNGLRDDVDTEAY